MSEANTRDLVEPYCRQMYRYNSAAVSDLTALRCEDPSLAVQSQAAEADINTIVKRFGVTGQLPATLRIPQYGDFGDVPDYHALQTYMVEAQSAFMALPAALRAEFNNDPGEFIAYVENPDNAEAVANTLGVELEGVRRMKEPAPVEITPPPTKTKTTETPGA